VLAKVMAAWTSEKLDGNISLNKIHKICKFTNFLKDARINLYYIIVNNINFVFVIT